MTNNNEQLSFLNEQAQVDNTSVVCLGMTFENEEARREYFREELRKKLPELKQIEGFPIGENEDIIALSDPPYYTACPNPWINDFIEEWEKEKVTKYGRDLNEKYHREPFAADISEGKNDPIYNAHSYHTKVPYKAIMRYILQYTDPGDIIYDGFSGSGMTGVASEMCSKKEILEELGYDEKFIDSRLGLRNTILSDISPAATFIAHNYNKKSNATKLEKEFESFLNELRKENIWCFSTIHNESNIYKYTDQLNSKNVDDIKSYIQKNRSDFGEINYVVWSEVFICPNCTKEFSYWESTVVGNNRVKKNPICPHCNAETKKSQLEKVYVSSIDNINGEITNKPKQQMVKINYKYNGKRYDKSPDEFDEFLYKLLSEISLSDNIINIKLPHGTETDRPIKQGLTHVHHFYSHRNLMIVDKFLSNKNALSIQDKQFLFGSTIPKLTKMNRFMPQHGSRALVGPMANALYFPPLSVENNALNQLEFQYKKIIKPELFIEFYK